MNFFLMPSFFIVFIFFLFYHSWFVEWCISVVGSEICGSVLVLFVAICFLFFLFLISSYGVCLFCCIYYYYCYCYCFLFDGCVCWWNGLIVLLSSGFCVVGSVGN